MGTREAVKVQGRVAITYSFTSDHTPASLGLAFRLLLLLLVLYVGLLLSRCGGCRSAAVVLRVRCIDVVWRGRGLFVMRRGGSGVQVSRAIHSVMLMYGRTGRRGDPPVFLGEANIWGKGEILCKVCTSITQGWTGLDSRSGSGLGGHGC